LNKRLWGALSLSLATSIWGGLYVVSKYVMDFVPPFTLLWLRYIIAGLVLGILMVLFRQHKIERRDLMLLVWIGFIGYFVSIGAQFVGTKLSDAHTGALLTTSSPVFTVLLARPLLQESLDMRKLIALFLAMLGIVMVIGLNPEGETSLPGSVFLIIAAVTWALLSIYVKKASARYSTLTITTYAVLFAVLFTTPAAMMEIQFNEVQLFANNLVWMGTLYIGIISTAVALFLWNKGMDLMDAGVGSLFMCFQPLVGSILGWLWLNESLTWGFVIGAVLILAGLIIVNWPRAEQNYS
jgi:drug/metabolite transporter (DMT)-like permease